MKLKSASIAFFALAVTAFFSIACAEAYYADVKIIILENGDAVIEGISNHPMLQEGTYSGYTSKEKTVWTINISPEGAFSDYLVEIHFPRNSFLSYLKMPSILSIGEDAGSVIVTSSGSDSEFFAIAQYQTNTGKEDYTAYASLALFGLSAAIVFFWFLFMRKNGRTVDSCNPSYNPDSLTERQNKIMDIIMRNNGSITQSQLQKLVGLPKASLSRNVDGLIRKGILTKEQKGMTNLICIKKKHS